MPTPYDATQTTDSATRLQEDVGEQPVVGGAGHGRVAREVGDAGIRQHVLDDQASVPCTPATGA